MCELAYCLWMSGRLFAHNILIPATHSFPSPISVCLLGSGSVGKSALAIRFTEDRFVESYDPTVEDCYRKSLQLDGEDVMLELIDTAGTEQFTSMVELYIRNCTGFVLVYDSTKKGSFTDLEDIRKKVFEVKKATKAKPPPMLIVANKCDQTEDREVLMAQGHTYASEWGATYFEASAKTNEHVEEVFMCILNKLAGGKKKGGGCTVM
eukprot:m.204124 g.204124  ORF g.204124 m.204124 type:complete len:208 (+) comp18461_c2_seq3:164-787(+)